MNNIYEREAAKTKVPNICDRVDRDWGQRATNHSNIYINLYRLRQVVNHSLARRSMTTWCGLLLYTRCRYWGSNLVSVLFSSVSFIFLSPNYCFAITFYQRDPELVRKHHATPVSAPSPVLYTIYCTASWTFGPWGGGGGLRLVIQIRTLNYNVLDTASDTPKHWSVWSVTLPLKDNFLRAVYIGGGGGTLNIYWWDVPRLIQKGARAQPKKGGLRHWHNPKRGS